MKPPMLTSVIESQVLRAIVRLIAVDVVDVLRALQSSAKVLLHHVTMLADITLRRIGVVRHSEHDIAEVVHISPWPTFYSHAVVTAKEAPHAVARDGRLLPTAAGTQLGAGILFVPVAPQVARTCISLIWQHRDHLPAAASTMARPSMPAKKVGRAVTKQVLLGQFSPTATGANGSVHTATIA